MQKIIFILSISILTLTISCNMNNDSKKSDKEGSSAVRAENTNDTAIAEEQVSYEGNNQHFKSFAAFKKNGKKLPVVLVVPEWWGVNDYTRNRVKQLAELGYLAMAVDMYGNGRVTESPDSAGMWVVEYYQNPQLAINNFEAAINKAKSFPEADTSRVAAIGYCFGGGIVLNMARLGENLKGVVSFHGGLNGYLPPAKKGTIKADILVCHGDADSMVKPDEVANFKKEMDNAGAHYKFIGYPNAKHAFTNPAATAIGEKYKLDIAYDEAADKQSWEEMKNFFSTIFK